jgi:hypothetical protein
LQGPGLLCLQKSRTGDGSLSKLLSIGPEHSLTHNTQKHTCVCTVCVWLNIVRDPLT